MGRILQFANVNFGLPRGAMILLNRSVGLGKKDPGALSQPIVSIGNFQCGECPFMNPGKFKRLNTKRNRLMSQSQRGLRVRV